MSRKMQFFLTKLRKSVSSDRFPFLYRIEKYIFCQKVKKDRIQSRKSLSKLDFFATSKFLLALTRHSWGTLEHCPLQIFMPGNNKVITLVYKT